jgi:hypothetical protein
MCKDFPWGEQFSEHQYSDEERLAFRYIQSVKINEDLHEQDQKYWDYHNYVITLNKANGDLWERVSRLHEEERGRDMEGRGSND